MPRDTHRVSILVEISKGVYQKDYTKGLILAREALSISDSLGFQKGRALSRFALANINYQLTASENALDYAMQALRIFEDEKMELEAALVYNTIGNIYYQKNNWIAALEYYNHSLTLMEKLNNSVGMIRARHNIGSVSISKKEYSKAIESFNENLKELRGSTNYPFLAATYNNLGNVYRFQLETDGPHKKIYADSARFFLDSALVYNHKLHDWFGIGNTYNNLADVEIKLRNFEKAELYLDKGKSAADSSGSKEHLMDNMKFRGEFFHAQNQNEKAYDILLAYSMMKDSIIREQNDSKFKELGTAYETEKKDADLKRTIEEKDIIKGYVKGLIILSVALAGGFFVVFILVVSVNRKNKKIIHQQEEILKRNEKLEELNREKDGLIGIVAHDLRAPLNRSLALAGLIDSAGELNDAQKNYITLIQKVANDGSRLIQDILELNTFENENSGIKSAEIDLPSWITEAVKSLEQQTVAKNINVELIKPSSFKVFTDEDILGRITDNILSNAIKFSPKGKKIIVKCANETSHFKISVKDEGPGLSEEDKAKMFGKFQKLSARPTGGESSTGLGLSIVKLLVEKLSGKIEVISEKGKGAEFIIEIPISQ